MKKEERPTPSDDDALAPTPERLAKARDDEGLLLISRIEMGENNVNWRAWRLNDAPLGRLFFCAKPRITAEQFAAGEAYYGVAYFAGMMPAITLDPTRVRVDGGGHKEISDRLIAARVRYEHIIKRMDFNLWHVVDALVVQEVALAAYAERFTRLSLRRDRQMVTVDRLCLGLDWLAEHFGMTRRETRLRAHVGERPAIPEAREEEG